MRLLAPLLLLSLLGTVPDATSAQRPGLDGFGPFIGEWIMQDAVNTFEWGPGRSSVIGRSYRIQDGTRVLVAHGIWYWHPGEETIAGRVVGTGMDVTLFAYDTRVLDGRLQSDLVTFAPDGTPTRFVEVMELLGEDRYEWRLLRPTDTTEIVMRGTFERR
jgi:hypothetical protein